MNNAFIIHGFNGDTIYTFGPHLRKELEVRNYNVIMPNFPIRTEATYLGWASILNQYKKFFNENTLIICHSIGNPFIIKYISENNLNAKLYVSVAGFCKLFKVPNREDLNNAFVDFQVNEKNIKYCRNNIKFRYSLYSDNDHVIPFDILKDFIDKLESVPVFISGVGHMGNKENITKLPQILDIVDKINN